MDSRKRRIMRAITDDYITNAEPVGSRTLARKYKLGVSPATIRNEMADLEESGYLEQPHTSAGRVPSDKGYRYYVDVLMDHEEIADSVKEKIINEFAAHRQQIENAIHCTVHMLAFLTDLASVATTPWPHGTRFRHMQLLPLDEESLLVVLVTDPGFVHNRILRLPRPISEERASQISAFFNSRLRGYSLRQITSAVLHDIREELTRDMLFDAAVSILTSALEEGKEKVYTDGMINIFKQPEFRDVERARLLLELLEEKEVIVSVLSESARRGGLHISIGSENKLAEMQDCSFVSAGYRMCGEVIGALGVIGPTRMRYSRAVVLVQFMAETLSQVLTEIATSGCWGR